MDPQPPPSPNVVQAVAWAASITTVILTPLVTLLTLFFTKGTESWRTRFKTRQEAALEDRAYGDKSAREAFDVVLAEQDKQIKALRNDLSVVSNKLEICNEHHAQCLVEQEKVRGDFKALQVHVDRLWSHEKAGKEQIKTNQEAILQVLQMILEEKQKTNKVLPESTGIKEGESGGQATDPC